MLWWWVVVFLAQLSWRREGVDRTEDIELSNATFYSKDPQGSGIGAESVRYLPDPPLNRTNMDSPKPYVPNKKYGLI